MNEDFLHYIWQYGLYDLSDFKTTDGREIRVVFPGIPNNDAGPDFLDAKLQIGRVMWVGHVEIHVNSSDWVKHKHQLDKAYDPVILHVVYNADKKVKNSLGLSLTEVELKINPGFYSYYEEMLSDLQPIPCGLHWQDFTGEG